MSSTLFFLLKVNICLLITGGIYELFLKNDPYFQRNRMFLLVSMIASLTLPFTPLESTTWVSEAGAIADVPALPESIYLITETSEVEPVVVSTVAAEKTFDISIDQALWSLYGMIALIMGGRMFFNIKSIMGLIKRGKRVVKKDYVLIKLENQDQVFSFFHYIFWGERMEELDDPSDGILKHELAHVKQWHTLDLMLAELLRIICWMNPMIYLIRYRLREVHEFIADQSASRSLNSPYNYAQLLVDQVRRRNAVPVLTHSFFAEQIKRRLLMLTQHSGTPMQRFKFYMLVPMTLLILAISYNLLPKSATFNEDRPILYLVHDFPGTSKCNENPKPAGFWYDLLFKMESDKYHPVVDKFNIQLITKAERNARMIDETWHDNDWEASQVVTMKSPDNDSMKARLHHIYHFKSDNREWAHTITGRYNSEYIEVFGVDWPNWREYLYQNESGNILLESGPVFSGEKVDGRIFIEKIHN